MQTVGENQELIENRQLGENSFRSKSRNVKKAIRIFRR